MEVRNFSSARKLVGRFTNISDAHLSIADINWLVDNIEEYANQQIQVELNSLSKREE